MLQNRLVYYLDNITRIVHGGNNKWKQLTGPFETLLTTFEGYILTVWYHIKCLLVPAKYNGFLDSRVVPTGREDQTDSVWGGYNYLPGTFLAASTGLYVPSSTTGSIYRLPESTVRLDCLWNGLCYSATRDLRKSLPMLTDYLKGGSAALAPVNDIEKWHCWNVGACERVKRLIGHTSETVHHCILDLLSDQGWAGPRELRVFWW